MVSIVRGSGAGSDKAAGFVAHFVREYFASDVRYELIALDDALGAPEAADEKQVLQRVDSLYAQGREAYDNLSLDEAVEFLNDAVRELERNAARVRDMKKVSEVLMLLGATHLLRMEESKGRERLSQAVAVHPGIEPDPTVFNPSMRNAFRQASASVRKARRGSLSINSNPSYAQVYVDGAFAGVAPMTLEGVPEGRHYVRLVKDGYVDYGTVVAVKGSTEVPDVAQLKPAAKFEEFDNAVEQVIKAERGGRDWEDLLQGLATSLGVDHLFLAQVRLEGERVVVTGMQFDLESDARMKQAKHSFAYDTQPATYAREVNELMGAHFGRDTLVRSTEGSSTYGEWQGASAGLVHAKSDVCPFGMACDAFRSRLLLFGGIVGGAALLGGGLFAYMGFQDHEEFLTVPQGSDEASALTSSGKLKAVLGDVFLGVGVAAVVTCTALYLYYQPSATPEDVVRGSRDKALEWSVVPLPGGGALSTTVRF